MSLFEFIMVFLSIIIGLSVAEILTALADTLSSRKNVKHSWLHGLLSLGIFLILIQIWWESWDLREIGQWAYSDMLLLLSIPVLLFIISRILNPGRDYSESLNDYYLKNASKIWIILSIGVIIGNSFRTILYGSKLLSIDNLSAIPILIICLILGISTNKTVHKVLIPVFVLIVLLDVLLINFFIS